MARLNVGVTVEPGLSIPERVAALEAAVQAIDTTLRLGVQGIADYGIRTDAARAAAAAVGLPPLPPEPST